MLCSMAQSYQSSSMETSGGDITRTNFDLSIGLTGLEMITTYYYRVISMNSGSGVTQSDIAEHSIQLAQVSVVLIPMQFHALIHYKFIFLQFLNHQICLRELPVQFGYNCTRSGKNHTRLRLVQF